MSEDLAAFIVRRLPASPVVGLDGIRLHLAAPSSGLSRVVGESTPYWAYRWAGGLALARHLRAHPDVVAGRRILDLGAGSGLVAIAAAQVGARVVLAAECDPNARVAIPLNAALNRVAVTLVDCDLAGDRLPDVDLILVGDLFYAEDLARRVTDFLERARTAGIPALVGDPGRTPLPQTYLEELARYDVVESGSRATTGAVFRFVGMERQP